MPNSFSINRSRCSVLSDPKLRDEIQAHTGSDAETSSILRSLDRFGHDVSIQYYDVTPMPSRRTYQSTAAFTWTVRAVR